MRKFMMCIALAALFGATVPALAAAEPGTFATARKGALDVTSSIFVTSRAVDQFGGWTDETKACTAFRTLRVTTEIFRTRPDGTGQHRIKVRQAPVMNCAEGGPNLGFSRTAASVGLSCPDGRWKPGRYDFVTRTKHLASGLVALGTLSWIRRGTC
ncbi:MAG TPA: hypothetical protein VK285_03800 [Gaiellaceae bacterium]|nr:hypothetical protein [Gaiellaceae bacterium]